MTTRTLTHSVGPVTFDARTFDADIEVTVTDTTHATVTISTTAQDGPSAEAVNSARLEHRPGILALDLRDRTAAGGITVTNNGRGVQIRAVSVASNVSIVGGRVFMNGAEITGTVTHAPITVRAELPRGSSIQASTESGQITTTGPLVKAGAHTVSGHVRIDRAENATVNTTSGGVEIGYAEQAVTRTVSGATHLDRVECANADSVSGSVTIHDAAGCTAAHTVSGDIAIQHTGPVPLTRTVSGRVHVTAAHPTR